LCLAWILPNFKHHQDDEVFFDEEDVNVFQNLLKQLLCQEFVAAKFARRF